MKKLFTRPSIKKLVKDRDLRQNMGKMARKLIEEIYDEKIIADKTAKVYKSLIETKF